MASSVLAQKLLAVRSLAGGPFFYRINHMAWIESHDNLSDHPKVFELAAMLGVEKHAAVGLLHLLWHFTLRYAWRDADLTRYSAHSICAACDWKKDPNTFLEALQKCGWLDGMKVHDWSDYAGKIVKDRLYRQKIARCKTTNKAEQSRKTRLPNITLPNRNKDSLSTAVDNPVDNSKKAKKPKNEETTPFWQDMVKHLHDMWERKKKAKLFMRPQEYKTLKSLAATYQPWGVMALWDDFLQSSNDWVRSTGYSFSAFVSHIPTLVDNYAWKRGAEIYEAHLLQDTKIMPDKVVQDALKTIGEKMSSKKH